MTYETPQTADDSRFWADAAQGRLSFQRCTDCDFMRWPAAGVCPECLGRGFDWETVDPIGTVWSYAVYHRAYANENKDRVPYNVALVELDSGVRLVTTLVGFADGQEPMGARVVARFGALNEHPSVPMFAPADATAARRSGELA
jgi:uncharacterized OB-fold protein